MSRNVSRVTQRKAIELELATRERFLAAVIATSPDGVIATDETGKVTLFNAAAEAIFGCAAQDVVGRPIGELFVDAPFPPVCETNVARKKCGAIFPIEVFVGDVRMSGNKGAVVFVRDLTAKASTRARLEALQAELVPRQHP
jgi:two-component system sensor kinase FixL